MSDTTEKSILSSIPDLDDNTPDTGTDTDGTSAGEGEGSSTETATDDTTTTVDGASSTVGKTDAPNEPPAIPRKHDGLVEKQNPNDPRVRDLVDPNTGLTVARGGVERRIFEGAQRVHRENNQLKQRLQVAETAANNSNEIVKLGTTLGVQHSDQVAALNLMSQFLKDPVKMLEALVVEVKSKGYQIPFLEQGVSPGMDTAAINRMLDQRMAPITEQRQAQEQKAQFEVEAKQTLDNFLDDHPEGFHNLSVLGEMIMSDPKLTIQNAYVNLVKWCAANGFDYTQPIKPQVEARQNQQQPAKTQAQNNPPHSAPLPNGRQPARTTPVNDAVQFDETASWSDIIRHAARESGYSS